MIINKIPARRKGLDRLWHAFLYSLSGLRYAFKDEIAFRQELLVFGILTVIVFFLPVSSLYKIFLILCNAAVFIVELINSAIESLVDHISPEYSEAARKAKDLGSSAVFLTLICTSVVWAYTLITVFKEHLISLGL